MCHGWELITSSFLKALKHLEIDDEKDDDDDVDGVCDDDIKFAKNKPIKWNVSSHFIKVLLILALLVTAFTARKKQYQW